jgi:hypothetical protein
LEKVLRIHLFQNELLVKMMASVLRLDDGDDLVKSMGAYYKYFAYSLGNKNQ